MNENSIFIFYFNFNFIATSIQLIYKAKLILQHKNVILRIK